MKKLFLLPIVSSSVFASFIDTSLILDASYVNRSFNDVGHLAIDGLTHAHHEDDGHDHNHAHMNESEGFNFNYAELAFSGAVDPSFDMMGVLHISEDSIEVEEAYFNTKKMPYNLRLKGGKFFSNFGRINSFHQHNLEFASKPTLITALLGEHGLLETGLQLNYLAPTDTYTQFGLELLKGENESSFGIEGVEDEVKGINIKDNSNPNLTVAYFKNSFDIDEDSSILWGLSYAFGDTTINHLEDDEAPHLFNGDGKLYGVDFYYKRDFSSYSFLSFQSEYIKRELSGKLYKNVNDTPTFEKMNLDKIHSGAYADIVYGINSNYRVGFRYDNILENSVVVNGNNQNKPENLNSISLKLDYLPSEFSKIRFQVTKDSMKFHEDGDRENYYEALIEFNMLIGKHLAHSF